MAKIQQTADRPAHNRFAQCGHGIGGPHAHGWGFCPGPLTCLSCNKPTTDDASVIVRPGERYCLDCIKAGKVTNPEPDCDRCGYTPCLCDVPASELAEGQ
jgi:hypothetical protein